MDDKPTAKSKIDWRGVGFAAVFALGWYAYSTYSSDKKTEDVAKQIAAEYYRDCTIIYKKQKDDYCTCTYNNNLAGLKRLSIAQQRRQQNDDSISIFDTVFYTSATYCGYLK